MNKIRKKFLSVLLVLAILLTAFPLTGFKLVSELFTVAKATEYEDFKYAELDDGTIKITDYFGDADVLTIPSEIDDKKVTAIGDSAFSGCSSLTKITIPDSVTTIGYDAFYDCSSLTEITIPDSVTTIGDEAFRDCSSLTEITIPNSVTTIGYGAFSRCSSLAKITIPDSVTTIGYGAFADCEDLVIYGIKGSEAERYANDNNITFKEIGSDEPVTPPTTEKPEIPSTTEPTTGLPTVPTTENPAVKPTASSVDKQLHANNGSVSVNEGAKQSTFKNLSTSAAAKNMFSNPVRVVDSNGKAVEDSANVATGNKIQVLDNNGNAVAEYTVIVKGDVAGNGKITSQDARLALRQSLRLENLSDIFQQAADWNNDNSVKSADARSILRKALRLD